MIIRTIKFSKISLQRPYLYSTQGNISFIDDYQITGFLGQGSTSRVFQGYHLLSNKQVIIKLFKNIPEEKISRQIRTNQLLRQCKHIIPLLDVIKDPACQSYALIFQNMKGVTFNHLVGKIGHVQGIKHIRDILQALKYCHQKGVVHRDIKSSNILITNQGAKLFDFGLSRTYGLDDFTTKRFGTKCYYSPEVIFRIPKFSHKVDIWVLGVILAQILIKKKPLMPYTSDQLTMKQLINYCGYDSQIVKDQNLKNGKQVNWNHLLNNSVMKPDDVQAAIQILKKMTSLRPEQRPEAAQILETQLFRKYE